MHLGPESQNCGTLCSTTVFCRNKNVESVRSIRLIRQDVEQEAVTCCQRLGIAWGRSGNIGVCPMSTTLQNAVESYARARNLSRGTRNEYAATVKKWITWNHAIPIEQLSRKDIREFLDWVHEKAIVEEGNKSRPHVKQSSGEPASSSIVGVGAGSAGNFAPLSSATGTA